MNIRFIAKCELAMHLELETNKRQRIKRATLELIAEHGLHNTPMSQISKHAQVSAGAIYHHFTSKDELITELYLDQKREMADRLLPALNINASYQGRWLQLWKNFYAFLTSDPLKLSFVEQCSTSPLISEDDKLRGEEFLLPMLKFLEDGMEQGHLKHMPVYLLGYLFYGSVLTTAKFKETGMMDISSEHIELAALSSWDGLKAQ